MRSCRPPGAAGESAGPIAATDDTAAVREASDAAEQDEAASLEMANVFSDLSAAPSLLTLVSDLSAAPTPNSLSLRLCPRLSRRRSGKPRTTLYVHSFREPEP